MAMPLSAHRTASAVRVAPPWQPRPPSAHARLPQSVAWGGWRVEEQQGGGCRSGRAARRAVHAPAGAAGRRESPARAPLCAWVGVATGPATACAWVSTSPRPPVLSLSRAGALPTRAAHVPRPLPLRPLFALCGEKALPGPPPPLGAPPARPPPPSPCGARAQERRGRPRRAAPFYVWRRVRDPVVRDARV